MLIRLIAAGSLHPMKPPNQHRLVAVYYVAGWTFFLLLWWWI